MHTRTCHQHIPEHTLSDAETTQLHDALARAEGSCAATAAACRLLEDLLEVHPGIPYLLVRVADIRSMLNSKATALALYKEVTTAQSSSGRADV